jgi:Competence protein CoiA-like family
MVLTRCSAAYTSAYTHPTLLKFCLHLFIRCGVAMWYERTMLTAKYSGGKQIVAAKWLTQWKSDFFCAECDAPVLLKVGSIRIPHFAHKVKSGCEYGSAPETEEHRRAKFEISGTGWVPQGMEAYPELKVMNFRPDILIRQKESSLLTGSRAIEFQRSAITVEELARRSEKYGANGIPVMWAFFASAELLAARYSLSAWEAWVKVITFNRVPYYVGKGRFAIVAFEPITVERECFDPSSREEWTQTIKLKRDHRPKILGYCEHYDDFCPRDVNAGTTMKKDVKIPAFRAWIPNRVHRY